MRPLENGRILVECIGIMVCFEVSYDVNLFRFCLGGDLSCKTCYGTGILVIIIVI